MCDKCRCSTHCFSVIIFLAIGTVADAGQAGVNPPPHRVFATSRFFMDEILTRPYDPDVPMGCVGDRLWASSPQGWAFRDDVHWLYLTNLKAFDIEIRDDHGLLHPAHATYYPSHVHMEGAVRAAVASASFTFRIDNVQNPLTRPFRPEKRWTCWSSGKREDWYAVDFDGPRTLKGVRVHFFDDAPSGGCRPPDQFDVQRWTNGEWATIEATERRPQRASKGENTVEFAPIETDRIRLVFRNAGEDFYTGLYGIEPVVSGSALDKSTSTQLKVRADKFITTDDVLVSAVRVENSGTHPAHVRIRIASPAVYPNDATGVIAVIKAAGDGSYFLNAPQVNAKLHDIDIVYGLRAHLESAGNLVVQKTPGGPTIETVLPPAGVTNLDCVMAVGLTRSEVEQCGRRWTAAGGNLANQIAEYQAWFDSNVAYFDCSDPWIKKMYYHRAYNLRKNLIDPKLGRMQWKTQSEGRWRSGWYPNVISYGGGHQVRESRWLRDKSYAQGHLLTFAENEKPDGVYPSHVRPNGPAGGQYTDWITATAWDSHLVHPDREFLVPVADKLAANVRGWQKVYDPDDDGLLLVDSHWWTGMEYQPSFFYFSDFKPAKNFHEPENKISLERVDLTAYNFGNAVAVARIYREIGQPEEAKEFEALAGKISEAVQKKMWDPGEKFFYSLRFDTKQKADVKEVIGVYPFYFDMLPPGQGYEAAWDSIIDPDQFWTTWPVASASKKCPAYSQSNWPGDGRAAGCMWNGPAWPHANSLVMTAMAKTLRGSTELAVGSSAKAREASDAQRSTLKAQHLFDLFYSFTKAQYREQDINFPWTGEFYNGETGRWKTAERDYNHSTWIDVLIQDIIGLVPRSDDVLEIDPLLPPGNLSHFLLDGQYYRGHDVTIVWDDPGEADHYGDRREGLDIYIDGRLTASKHQLARITVPLGNPKRLK